MHLPIVLVLALDILVVQSYNYGQPNDYDVEDESGELDEQEHSTLVRRCGCLHIYSCPYEYRDLTVSCSHIGSLHVHCCISVPKSEKPNEYGQVATNTNGHWLWSTLHHPTHITIQIPTRITSSLSITQVQPLTTSQQMISTTQPIPPQSEVQTQTSIQLPTKNTTPKSNSQGPPLTSAQTPITSTSPRPQSASHSEVSPSSTVECVCTPFFRCYDEETSSNLTNAVDDRSTISCLDTKAQEICNDSDDVCCCNLEEPAQQPQELKPFTELPNMEEPAQQPQELKPFTKSPQNCQGNCRPIGDCHDKSISSTISNQGTCTDPAHVCCEDLVLPESPNPSVTPLQTSTQSPSLHPPSLPQTPTRNPSSLPPSSTPSEIYESVNASECTCTPFYECYDPETSSILSDQVNDRNTYLTIPETNTTSTDVVNDTDTQCSSTEVCCHNLVPPSSIMESTGDCSGSCIPIKECPSLSLTLEDAQRGNLEAIQKLRNLVCSSVNGMLNICCPTERS